MRFTRLSSLIALTAATAAASCTVPAGMEDTDENLANASRGTGLKGEYFDNADLTGLKLTRTDPTVNFNWAEAAPASGMGADEWSARWTGQVNPAYSETYTFYVSSDDGVRLWVGGKLVIDGWTDHGVKEVQGTIALTAGQLTDIKLEYYDRWSTASVVLSWSSNSRSKQVIPSSRLYPAGATAPAPTSTTPPTPTPAPTPTSTTPPVPTTPPPNPTPPPGSVARPSYNTGTGFFVVGSKLYDANGNEFRIRGINHLHWDSTSPGIVKTGSNTERWVIDFNRPIASNIQLMQQSINNKMVPMPGNWDGTCKEDSATLSNMVSKWVSTASSWKSIEKYVLINIANEWGPGNSTTWRDGYIDAVAKLRAAGILATIVVDAGGCGQDNADLASYAKAVFNSDPQKNVIFDQHIYGMWQNGGGSSWQTDLNKGLDALVATGLPFVVGEFGPGRSIGPSPTDMTPGQIIQASEARGIGWMAWAWDDPAGQADDTWFALSYNGDYRSSSDLTIFGKEVVENGTYGLKKLAKPASIF